MIKLKLIEKTSYGMSKYNLFLNEELLKTVAVDGRYITDANGELIRIISGDPIASKKIMSHTVKDFPPVEFFHFRYKLEWTDLIDGFFITHKEDDTFELLFDGLPDLSQWKNQFSFDEYCKELSKLLNRNEKSAVNFDAWNGNVHGDQPPGFNIRINIELTTQPIINEVSKWEDIIHKYHTICLDALSEGARKRRSVLSAKQSRTPGRIKQRALKEGVPTINFNSNDVTENLSNKITLKYKDRASRNIYNRYELLIGGIVLENAFALGDSPDNIHEIECNDPNTSRRLLNHSINDFPTSVNGMRFKYIFEWTDIFETIAIYDTPKKGMLITLLAWPDLRKWKNIYSFGEYCEEMTRSLNSKKLDDFEFRTYQNDYSNQHIEINFPLSSPNIPIINDMLKWEMIIRECHASSVHSLSAHHSVDRIKLLPDKSQCCINGRWFPCSFSSGKLIVGGHREKTRIPLDLFHDCTVNDLPANSEFNLEPNKAEFEYLDHIAFHRNEEIILNIICTFNFKKWDRPWNLYSFLKDMSKIFNSRCAPSRVLDLDINESGAPIVDMYIESQHTRGNTLETWIDDAISSIKHVFEIVETKYAAEESVDFKNRIVREIEFSPEYYQAGLSIISYFGSILRQKYSDSNVKVKIVQDNMIVRMIIETPEGKKEELEKTLTDYGRVINGSLSPEIFLTNPIDALQLKQQLNLARVQLENQKELLSFQNQQYTSRLIGLEEEVKWLRSHIAAVMSFSGDNAAALSTALNNLFAVVGCQNQKIETALETISHKIQAGISEADHAEIMKAFIVIKEEDEGAFKKVVGLFNELIIKGSIAGVSGNLLFEWLKSLI